MLINGIQYYVIIVLLLLGFKGGYQLLKLRLNRKRLTDIENKLMVTKGERGLGEDGLGIWG